MKKPNKEIKNKQLKEEFEKELSKTELVVGKIEFDNKNEHFDIDLKKIIKIIKEYCPSAKEEAILKAAEAIKDHIKYRNSQYIKEINV